MKTLFTHRIEALLTGLLFGFAACSAQAQVLPGQFIPQTGSQNSLDEKYADSDVKPVLVDIDNDGDLDLFVREDSGYIVYYENMGSASSPAYTQRTGGSNPMDGVDVGERAYPAFADLDNDGDFDLVIEVEDGIFNFYENTGSAASPTFVQYAGVDNASNGVDVDAEATPAFGELDNDNDVIIGDYCSFRLSARPR